MATQTLSAADQSYLSAEQQEQILALKQAWADANAAGDQAGMARANQQAEAIRATAGYSGGSDGSGYTKLTEKQTGTAKSAAVTGAGASAEEVQKWVDNYKYTNYADGRGWVNGFSSEMNLRSIANYIRQQMQANSNAWAGADETGRAYLHEQNLQLAKILENSVGGAKSTYNEALGRWETVNANLGYGYNTGSYNDLDWCRNYYGMTDEQIEAYRSDTNRYRNYVDQSLVRNWIDESSGYTGRYAQFVNGPYAILLRGDNPALVNPYYYKDVIGDGEGNDLFQPVRAADGTILPQAPYLKNNNGMSDYTKQFSSYVDENGVIQTGQKLLNDPAGSWGPASPHIGQASIVENGGSGGLNGAGLLDQWRDSASQQVVTARDYAVDQAVQQLLQAQTEAEQRYQNQRNQIAAEERNALDNSALYAELRGDRGGIGQSQYNQIQAQAAANRQAVSTAQSQLAADTARQIAQLRAEGEFQKADDLLDISQTYLLKLLQLEQWAAEFQFSQEQFQASMEQWEQEFLLKAAKAMM